MSGRGGGRRRVCVTGGLGFIGSHLCELLAERGHEVLCVDRARTGQVVPGRPDPTRMPGVEVVRADLTSVPLEPMFEGVDAVFHLAALPGVRAVHGVEDLWLHNAEATRRVAAALPAGRRLVLASTSSVYGNARRLPTPEIWPAAPLNPYAASKLAAEYAALASAEGGADVVVCRLFTVFGPGQRPDMAFSRWIEALAAGSPVTWCAPEGARRAFTYVRDGVAGLLAALERGRSGEVYNLGGTGCPRVRSALSEIEAILDREAHLVLRPGYAEAVVTEACGRKALRELDYSPSVGLREGLERQVEAALAGLEQRTAASFRGALARGGGGRSALRGAAIAAGAPTTAAPAPASLEAGRIRPATSSTAGRRRPPPDYGSIRHPPSSPVKPAAIASASEARASR